MINDIYVKRMPHTICILVLSLIFFSSCEKYLEGTDDPKIQIEYDNVFSNDVTANAAVLGLYTEMLGITNFAGGGMESVTYRTALSADEIVNYPKNSAALLEFENNKLTSANATVRTQWSSMYKVIYMANAILEGLAKTTTVSETTKQHLRGEALLVRAFCHFYAVNLFGEIPIVTTTDYKVNATLSRMPVNTVYEQIEEDLLEAKSLIQEEYSGLEDDFFTPSRSRPNRYAAIALLARVYLYQGKWEQAEAEADLVINNTATYELINLQDVFLISNREAIWQITPNVINGVGAVQDAVTFLQEFDFTRVVLRQELVDAFDATDARISAWMKPQDPGDGSEAYLPFKYKQPFSSNSVTEYKVIIRLAEVYLIRAEARAQQNKLSEAIADVDMIRDRAGLVLIADTDPSISQSNLLQTILHERQKELFTEMGHRWFDLKRTNNITAVLGPLKPDWTDNDKLYPIPALERANNPNLGDQNPGY